MRLNIAGPRMTAPQYIRERRRDWKRRLAEKRKQHNPSRYLRWMGGMIEAEQRRKPSAAEAVTLPPIRAKSAPPLVGSPTSGVLRNLWRRMRGLIRVQGKK